MALLNFFRRKHKCNFSKPIASKYISFLSRDIIFECECGNRELRRVTVHYEESFPIPTNLWIPEGAFDKLLKTKKLK